MREQREAERKQREADFLRTVDHGEYAQEGREGAPGAGRPAGGGHQERPDERPEERTKACEVCGPGAGPKPLTRFPKVADAKRGAHPDGRASVCRECRKAEGPDGREGAAGRPALTSVPGTARPREEPEKPGEPAADRGAKRARIFCVYGDRCIQPGIEGPVRLASDQKAGDPCSYCLRNNPGVVSAEDVRRAKKAAEAGGDAGEKLAASDRESVA